MKLTIVNLNLITTFDLKSLNFKYIKQIFCVGIKCVRVNYITERKCITQRILKN